MMIEVNISQDALIEVLSDLEFLVISIDRIGSLGLSIDRQRDEVYNFMQGADVYKKLANTRKILSCAVDESVSLEVLEVIDTHIEKVTAWKPEG